MYIYIYIYIQIKKEIVTSYSSFTLKAIIRLLYALALLMMRLSCYCRQSVVCKVQVAVGNGSVVFVLS